MIRNGSIGRAAVRPTVVDRCAHPSGGRDVDLDAARLSVRRSVGTIKSTGAGEQLLEGSTPTGHARVVDLDAGTVAALRRYRAVRGELALDPVRETALVLSNFDGTHRHPERFSRWTGSPER